MNMVQDFASTRLATVIQAVLDGPKEHSTYDTIIEESVYELQKYAPVTPDSEGMRPCVCTYIVTFSCESPWPYPDATPRLDRRFAPLSESTDQRCDDAGWRHPKLVANTWKVHDGKIIGIEKVGIFLIWTGIMCDLPMRCKMYRNVQWNAYHPCEQCGIRGEIETGAGGKTSGMKVTGWALVTVDYMPAYLPS
jgi:hypothetical protein